MNTLLRGNWGLDLQQNRCSAISVHVRALTPWWMQGSLAPVTEWEQATHSAFALDLPITPQQLAQVSVLSYLFYTPATITACPEINTGRMSFAKTFFRLLTVTSNPPFKEFVCSAHPCVLWKNSGVWTPVQRVWAPGSERAANMLHTNFLMTLPFSCCFRFRDYRGIWSHLGRA